MFAVLLFQLFKAKPCGEKTSEANCESIKSFSTDYSIHSFWPVKNVLIHCVPCCGETLKSDEGI